MPQSYAVVADETTSLKTQETFSVPDLKIVA
jgi:hypothetical protein